MIQNRLGYKPSPAGHRVPSLLMHPKMLLAPGPAPSSALAPGGPVLNQGNTSSCVGHAISAAITPSIGFTASPDDIYRLARCMARADYGPLQTALTDRGSSPDEACRGLQVFGCRPMRGTGDTDVDPATVNDEPKFGDILQDASTLLVGQYGLLSSYQVMQALGIVGKAVTVSSYVDTAFESWTAGMPPLGMPNTGDPSGGYHYLCVRGYTTDPTDGTVKYLVQNSWGAGWGDNGFVHVSKAWMDQVSDMFVWDVRKV